VVVDDTDPPVGTLTRREWGPGVFQRRILLRLLAGVPEEAVGLECSFERNLNPGGSLLRVPPIALDAPGQPRVRLVDADGIRAALRSEPEDLEGTTHEVVPAE
jgi:hypothetical protein